MNGIRRVYIVGPISGLSEEYYMFRFKRAENFVKRRGYIAVNPTVISKHFPDFNWLESMTVTECLLSLCDTIYVLKGWQNSRGALMEIKYAKEHGYNIINEGEFFPKCQAK